ncbi:uncharacterized protein LOC102347875 [Latimeria chalumnae]|uniref:uncharacterized protein LOC102347875 n=1 Tax=Latimeria chalumnae TaxID=7897 RepID=UPI00313F0BD9
MRWSQVWMVMPLKKIFSYQSKIIIIEHTESQKDVNVLDVENAAIQTDKSNCCCDCIENNIMLHEVLKHLKRSGNQQTYGSAAQSHTQYTPSMLGITLNPGLLEDQLVFSVCGEAEVFFQHTVQDEISLPELQESAAQTECCDRGNGNSLDSLEGTSDLAVAQEPLPVLEFTVPPEPVASSSNSDTATVNTSFMPNTNQSIPSYPFVTVRRQPVSTVPLNVCPHNHWTLEDIRMRPLTHQLLNEMRE